MAARALEYGPAGRAGRRVNFDRLNRAVLRTFRKKDGDGALIAWTRGGIAQPALSGIFDRRHYDIPTADGTASVSTLITSLSVNDADLGEIDGTERFTIDGEAYEIAKPRADGQGMTVLELEIAEVDSDG